MQQSETFFNRPAISWPVMLAALLAINLLQGSFTELTSDEGYYWFYARHLQWGYYDHPPLVAVLIKAGTSLLPGTAGVRFFNLLFVSGAQWLAFLLLPQQVRQSKKSYLLLLAAPLIHYLAFIVFPDGPLLFFSLCYLHAFRAFITRQTGGLSIAIGASAALMIYAKYHGVLVIFFSLLAVPVLFRSAWLWFAGLVAALLLLPHLVWQWQHQFPTFRYHLAGRSDEFSLSLATQYITQQLIVLGPAFLVPVFVVKTPEPFEKSLRYIIIGTLVFFLVSSFKTFVHFHWTSIAVFPMFYLAVLHFSKKGGTKLLSCFALPYIIVIMGARLLLGVDMGFTHANEDFYHGRKQWAREMENIAAGRWVFFPDNLREAPLYEFYSGGKSATLYSGPHKKSQYELWNYEDSLQAMPVLVVNKYPVEGTVPVSLPNGQTYHMAAYKSFQSYFTNVSAKLDKQHGGFTIKLQAAGSDSVFISPRAKLVYVLMHRQDVVESGTIMQPLPGALAPGNMYDLKVSLHPSASGDLYIGIRMPGMPDAVISNPVRLP